MAEHKKCTKGGGTKSEYKKCKIREKERAAKAILKKQSAAINKGELSKEFPTTDGKKSVVGGKGALGKCKSEYKQVANRINVDTVCTIKLKK